MTVRFDVETEDGAVLAARRSGQGDPLVLVSGLGGSAAFWDPLVAALGPGRCIVTFDQRGIGGSSRGTLPVDIARLADDVLRVCDDAGIGPAALLGHSTGGCIVQQIAATAPDRVERIALSAAWRRPSRYMTALFGLRLSLLRSDPEAYAASAALLSHAPDWLEAHWEKFETSVAAAPHDPAKRAVVAERIQALMDFDGAALSGRIAPGATVIGADDDMIVPAFLQEELARALPQARRHRLTDGGHFYPLTRGDRFAAIVADWLQHPPQEEVEHETG